MLLPASRNKVAADSAGRIVKRFTTTKIRVDPQNLAGLPLLQITKQQAKDCFHLTPRPCKVAGACKRACQTEEFMPSFGLKKQVKQVAAGEYHETYIITKSTCQKSK